MASVTTARRSARDDIGFPFTAIVGQDELLLALVLCTVHPGIGGVLVRGEKGTAKSTAVRALAALLPPVTGDGPEGGPGSTRQARLVELPIGATEDRVVGSLDLERVLRDGEPAFQPGLLAAAHEGVLYVDEVNLLHDHLVDVLLDAAAMGRVHIERDGVSHTHPARFVLVGTMNPEEGELRPQLLDRFGLTVDVAASREVDSRVEVMRRRLAYEADPVGFAENHAAAEAEMARRIADARSRLPSVALPERELRRIAALCATFEVDGMRADLVLARAACAHAAWTGAQEVTEADVRVAAAMTLPHRRRRDPFDEPGLDDQELEDAFSRAGQAVDEGPDEGPDGERGGDPQQAEHGSGDQHPGGPDDPDDPGPDDPGPGGGAPHDAGDPGTPPAKGPASDSADRTDQGDGRSPSGRPFGAGSQQTRAKARRFEVPGVGEGEPGRRSRSRTRTGRMVRPAAASGGGLHLVATLFAAARRGGALWSGGRVQLTAADLRGAEREGREGNLVVFVVDASGSMAARSRLTAVAMAVVSLLRDAYQRRDKVAVIAFRGADAELVLPPTSSVDIAAKRLSELRTGGKTPLAEGLLKAREIIARERTRDPQRRALTVVVTDGRATGGTDPVGRARLAATLLADVGAAGVVVDCERGFVRLGLAGELARHLRARCVRLDDVSPDAMSDVVRTHARAA